MRLISDTHDDVAVYVDELDDIAFAMRGSEAFIAILQNKHRFTRF